VEKTVIHAMFHDGEARAADGTRLWYRVYDGPAGATPLVLSNGAACSIHYWPLLVEHFAGRVPIVLWDYRGHGRSGRAPLDTYDIAFFARDLVAVLDDAGIERATLAGHSMGVQVILEAYGQAPERAAALVPMFGTFGEAISTFSKIPGAATIAEAVLGGLETYAAGIGRFVQPTVTWPPAIFLARLVGSNLDLCPPQYLRALMEHIRTLEPELIARVFRSVVRHSAAEVLPRIEVPTLIFAGARDRMTPPSLAERMRSRIPGAELAVVDHGSHLAMLENPGFVHCRLELFLRDRGLLGQPAPAAAGPSGSPRSMLNSPSSASA
jgi:pimeloyl-ACP methyl ester carboxylesterase